MFKLLLPFVLFVQLIYGASIKAIDNDQLQQLIEKRVVIIDIRTEDEWEKTGIIPGSYKINYYNKEGEANTKRWLYIFARLVRNKGTTFVLVSSDGKEAEKLANMLYKEIGYSSVLYLNEGINAWIDDERKVIDF